MTTPVPNGTVLVIDVGTSSVRAAAVGRDGTVAHDRHRETLPLSPAPGLVEFDPAAIADAALELARAVLAEAGPVDAVGIANQRASTIVWDRATGEPLGPGLGWQDLRTVGDCLMLAADGIRLAPNLSATKLAHLLGLHDPERDARPLRRHRRLLDRLAPHRWRRPRHRHHQRRPQRPAHRRPDGDWDDKVLGALRIPEAILPTVVDSIGVVGEATALDGSPPIAGILGDQQASLLGQGCVRAGQAKVTFGTGGMLDVCLDERPDFPTRGRAGTFPIVTRSRDGFATWGIEAVMLAAGTNVEWLRDDLGLIPTAAASHDVAAACDDTDGVAYVPALLGLGAPTWDYGARGALLGLTRGIGPTADRAGGARGHRPARRRPGRRRGRPTAAIADPGAPRRRRHVRQPDLPPSRGRRHAAAGRGLPRHRGHHRRRRVRRRPRRRYVVGTRRGCLALGPAGHRRARSRPGPRALGGHGAPGRRVVPRSELDRLLSLAPMSRRAPRSAITDRPIGHPFGRQRDRHTRDRVDQRGTLAIPPSRRAPTVTATTPSPPL